MSLSVTQIAVNGFDKNFSYLIHNDNEALLVDPTGDCSKLEAAIAASNCTVIGVLITHTHHDHLECVEHYLQLPIYVHTKGRGALPEDARSIEIHDGDSVTCGEDVISIIYTPGHSDDAVCFYIKPEVAADGVPKIITGDTLFVEGCGRTSEQRVKDLYESLAELAALPEETEVYPGHDYGSKPHSNIGYEKTHNRFYQAKNFADFHQLRLG